MKGKKVWLSAVFAAAILWLIPAQVLAGETVWEGKAKISGRVTIPPGEVLVVKAGTEVEVVPSKDSELFVQGKLIVEGTREKPVRFSPGKEGGPPLWKGITLVGSKESVVSFCVVEGALKGFSLVDSSLKVSHSTFRENRVAFEVNQKSRLEVEGSVFEGNYAGIVVSLSGEALVQNATFRSIRDTGIVVQNGGRGKVVDCTFSEGKKGLFALTNAPLVVEGSRFSSLDVGVVLRQAGKTTEVTRCSFENNQTGILTVQFTACQISDCVIRKNRVGLDAREFSSPHVTHCEFTSNETAVNLFRKSNSLIDFNVFLNNRTAIMIDYSSYPGIFNNNFERNDMHIRLGKFQSGDWEAREGSRRISRREAMRRGSRNMAAFDVKVDYPGRVNARGNFWGTDLGEPSGEEMNLEKIWDGRDFGPVKYEGYGDREYKIDIVDFSDWKRAPVPDAGVRKGS
ncbi:MAG: right-handed parallel beta-helix repeat-containing protein [Deltaproteobacteria bacterium]|nr:MAG: right-handed parallel beta-helix repeat-containing protein [Deltaproteobacteria bacterium]